MTGPRLANGAPGQSDGDETTYFPPGLQSQGTHVSDGGLTSGFSIPTSGSRTADLRDPLAMIVSWVHPLGCRPGCAVSSGMRRVDRVP